MRTPLRTHGLIGRAGVRGAFTLIEILIVVVILGILASIVLASVHKATEDSAQTVTRSELAKVKRHLEAYRSVNSNQYPVVAEGEGTWGQLVSPSYMTQAPRNAWVGGANAQRIVFGTGPDSAFTESYGWIFNPSTGEVWAASFDASGAALPR